MAAGQQFRVATYNIHKCQGFDRRVLPQRIIDVIRDLNADVLCLQEVVNAPERAPLYDQAGEIAKAFPDYACCFGSNRTLHGGGYGNMTLSRLPLQSWRNLDITKPGREPRGVLHAAVAIEGGASLHVFNVHLGTGFAERRFQGERLLGEEVLHQPDLAGPRIVVGDFNEWTHGLTSKLLKDRFETFRPKHAARFPRTFPGLLPIWTLDHCYYEGPLQLLETRLWRSRKALIASDHLPLVADFCLGGC